jgi:putative inorganic carbon (HCO3(-)) transporter
MTAANVAFPAQRLGRLTAWIRSRADIWLALALGLIVAILILGLPMKAALASSVVGAFVIVALMDTRVAVLALLLIRAAIDVTATTPLIPAGAAELNANALMSLLVVGFACAHIALNRINVRNIPLASPFIFFIGITFVGLPFAVDMEDALEDWLRIVSTFMIYVLVVDVMHREEDRRWLVKVIVLAAIVPLAAGLYQFAFDAGNHVTPGYNRLEGTFVHPSPFAFFLLQVIPLGLLLFMHTSSRLARVGLGVMLPVMVFSIYMTQTRGAWIGLVALLMVFLWVRARWMMLLVPLVAIALVMAVPSTRARIEAAVQGPCPSASDCQSSLFWRWQQWQAATEIAPLPQLLTVGAGLDSVQEVLGQSTHNEYVRLFVEAGLPGLIAVLLLYRGLLMMAINGYRQAAKPYDRDLMLAFLMAMTARLVIAAADNTLVIVVLEWYFWALAGVIVVQSGAYDRFARVRQREQLQRAQGARRLPPGPLSPEGAAS